MFGYRLYVTGAPKVCLLLLLSGIVGDGLETAVSLEEMTLQTLAERGPLPPNGSRVAFLRQRRTAITIYRKGQTPRDNKTGSERPERYERLLLGMKVD